MLLDTETRFLGAIVATAIVASNVIATVEYEDTIQEKVTPSQKFTSLIAATATILSFPARNTARRVIEIHIYNSDSATHDVTVFIGDGVAQQVVKKSLALAANKTLYYNRLTGWVVV